MSASRSLVYALGDVNVDVLMPVQEYPAPGGDQRSERTVIEAGGSAANTAACLAKLSLPTALLASVGRDVLADLALAALGSAGVNLEHLQSSDETTGIMFVPVTPDGQRTLFGRPGANRLLRPEGLPLEDLSRARALHLSGYALLDQPQSSAASSALSQAAGGGAFLSLDTANEPPLAAREAFEPILPEFDLLILGERQALVLAGDEDLECALGRLLELGVGTIAVKRGRHGCILVAPSERYALPAMPVNTVDSTGAGDCFSAGLLFGMLEGLTLPAAGLVANAAGALATTRWGAGANVPNREEIRALLADRGSVFGTSLAGPLREALDRLAA